MSYVRSMVASGLIQDFQKLETDQQLALFWFIYTEMGESITPAAPAVSTVASPDMVEALLDQVKELPSEQQLQVQRGLVDRKNSLIGREYSAMSDTTKLLFWYRLAQEMEKGAVISFPAQYELSRAARHLFHQIKRLDFGRQITLFRDVVAPMGAD